jgi:hypothetical protein
MNLLTKQCAHCKETKSPSEFYKDENKKSGLTSWCRLCQAAPEQRLRRIKTKAKNRATPEGRAKSLLDGVKYSHGTKKRATLEKTLTVEDILPILQAGKCQVTGLSFDFSPAKDTFKNPYAPSLDRIDSKKGYTKENCRVVLTSVNDALGEHDDNDVLPILEALVKGLKKNVKKNTAAPVPTGDHIPGAVGAELGSVSTPWTWQDDDHTHHHCGADARQDTDHRPQTSSGDSLGRGGQEVGTSKTLEGFKDYWQSREKARRVVG